MYKIRNKYFLWVFNIFLLIVTFNGILFANEKNNEEKIAEMNNNNISLLIAIVSDNKSNDTILAFIIRNDRKEEFKLEKIWDCNNKIVLISPDSKKEEITISEDFKSKISKSVIIKSGEFIFFNYDISKLKEINKEGFYKIYWEFDKYKSKELFVMKGILNNAYTWKGLRHSFNIGKFENTDISLNIAIIQNQPSILAFTLTNYGKEEIKKVSPPTREHHRIVLIKPDGKEIRWNKLTEYDKNPYLDVKPLESITWKENIYDLFEDDLKDVGLYKIYWEDIFKGIKSEEILLLKE